MASCPCREHILSPVLRSFFIYVDGDAFRCSGGRSDPPVPEWRFLRRVGGAEGIHGEGDDCSFLRVFGRILHERYEEVLLSQRESVPGSWTHAVGQVGTKKGIESRVLHFGSESWDLFLANSVADSPSFTVNYEFKVNISPCRCCVPLNPTRYRH